MPKYKAMIKNCADHKVHGTDRGKDHGDDALTQAPVFFGPRRLDPPVILAPMAGITDRPFRDVVGRFGAGLVVSEMIASQDMVNAKKGTREKAELGFDAQNTSVQIAGRDPFWMGEAARLIEDQGARMIDINMGCPAKQVTSGQSGSALMRTPDLALRLIDAVVAATRLPVSLKMRLGWDHDCLNAPDIAVRAESAGVQMITIHGRTRCQFYKGRADWRAIAPVVDAVSVPVIANGDIVDTASAQSALDQSGAAGIMVGRGAQGQPWQLAQIAADLFGKPAPKRPQGAALADLVIGHYEAMLSFYGTDLGLRVARKHLGWYLDLVSPPKALRRAILTAQSPTDVINLLRGAFDRPAQSAAA